MNKCFLILNSLLMSASSQRTVTQQPEELSSKYSNFPPYSSSSSYQDFPPPEQYFQQFGGADHNDNFLNIQQPPHSPPPQQQSHYQQQQQYQSRNYNNGYHLQQQSHRPPPPPPPPPYSTQSDKHHPGDFQYSQDSDHQNYDPQQFQHQDNSQQFKHQDNSQQFQHQDISQQSYKYPGGRPQPLVDRQYDQAPVPVPVYVNNYGKDDHSVPDVQSYQYQPQPQQYDEYEHEQHPEQDQFHLADQLDRDDGPHLAADEDSFSFGDDDTEYVDVGYHGQDEIDGFGFEGEDSGNYGMYFDQKYQQRLAAQEEFEKEVEANIDNRIHSTEADTDYDGVDNTVEIDTYTYEDYSGSDRSHESQQLEYDHNKNSDLELLDRDTEYDSDDLFTFNAHEIYISDNHDQDFDRNYEDYGEQIDEKNDNFEAFDGFGSDDLFFPQNNLKRSSYDKDFYEFYEPSPPEQQEQHDQPHPRHPNNRHQGQGPHHPTGAGAPYRRAARDDSAAGFPDIFSESGGRKRPQEPFRHGF